jgi:hypothetical protein
LKEVEQLSRAQLKGVLGGHSLDETTAPSDRCLEGVKCTFFADSNTGSVEGECETNSNKKCICNAGSHSILYEGCVRVV